MTMMMVVAFVLQAVVAILGMGIAYRLGTIAGMFLSMFDTKAV